MCFTIPKKILQLKDGKAIIEGNITVDVGHLEACNEGDYLCVTSGIATNIVSEDEAIAMRSLIKKTNEELS